MTSENTAIEILQAQPNLLTGIEAQQLVNSCLDMLDALENLILYQSYICKEDFSLEVWQDAIKAVKKAGGTVYL